MIMILRWINVLSLCIKANIVTFYRVRFYWLRCAERSSSCWWKETPTHTHTLTSKRMCRELFLPVWRAAGWQPWTGSSSWCWNDDSQSSPHRMLLAPPEESTETLVSKNEMKKFILIHFYLTSLCTNRSEMSHRNYSRCVWCLERQGV